MNTQNLNFYITGGTLPPDSGSYVTRQADADLLEGLRGGEFCYVLNTRQMGKSSLMIRTAQTLRADGCRIVILDLTAIGQNLTVEQWYVGLLGRIAQQTDSEDELFDFWAARSAMGPMQRFVEALRHVLLRQKQTGETQAETQSENCGGKLILFIDEIDAVRSLPFSADEFFAGIRECWNRRASEPVFRNLTFCLLGVATPSDLIRDTRVTPFNIGRRIELHDFTREEAAPLAEGLRQYPGDTGAEALLDRVLHWTGGHPYMTQRLCRAVAESLRETAGKSGGRRDEIEDAARVDALCQQLFLTKAAQESDDNLAFARTRLLRGEEDRAALLDLYGQALRGRRVKDDETNPLCPVLRLSGVVKAQNGWLILRNEIYRRVFDSQWIAENMPDAEVRRQKRAYRRGLMRAASVSVGVLAIVAVLAGIAIKSAISARRAESKATAQEKLANSRLSHLYVETGTRLMESGDSSAALAPLAEAMELDKDAPERMKMHRLRFESALARAPHIERMWFADGPIRWASYSPNKKWIAAIGEEGRARLWNAATGAELPLEMRHKGGVAFAAFSPDGTRLATCGMDSCARVWDLTGRRLQYTLPCATPDSKAEKIRAAWSRDGKRLVICAFSRLDIWDMSGAAAGAIKPDGSGAPPLLSKNPADYFSGVGVEQAEFSADGNQITYVAGNSLAETLRISDGKRIIAFALGNRGFDVRRPVAERKRLLALGGCYVGRHIAFAADGRRVAIAGQFDGQGRKCGACVFDAQTGKAGAFMRHAAPALYAAFSPDGARIATASADHTAQIWNAVTGKALTPPMRHAGNVTQIEFSPDGRRVVTASADGAARVWDATTGAACGSSLRHAGAVIAAQFGRDGSHVLTAGRDGTVRCWTLPPDQPDSVLFAENQCGFIRQRNDTLLFTGQSLPHLAEWWTVTSVFDLASGAQIIPPTKPSPSQVVIPCANSARCLIVRDDRQGHQEAQVCDTRTGRPLSPALRAYQILISPDGGVLFANDRKEIWTADAMTGKRLETLYRAAKTTRPEKSDAGGAADSDPTPAYLREQGGLMIRADDSFCVDNRGLLFSDGPTLHRVDFHTGKEKTPPMPHEASVAQAILSPDGRFIFTQTVQCVCRIWNAADGSPASLPSNPPGKPDAFRHMRVHFSPDNRYALTEGVIGEPVWALFGPQPFAPRLIGDSGPFHPRYLFGLSPDGAYFFDLRQGSQLRRLDTGTVVTPPLNHSAPVVCLAFSPDSQKMISGSEDGSARIWDTHTAAPLTPPMPHNETVFRVFFSADGRMAATGTEGGIVRVWDAATGEALTPPLRLKDKVKTESEVANLEFTRDGGTLIASSLAAGRFWKLRAATESLPHLQALAQLLSGQHYDVRAGMVPLDSVSLRAAWTRYQEYASP